MQDHFQFFLPQSNGLKSLVSNFFYIRSSEEAYLREQIVLPYPQLTLGFFLKSPFEVKKKANERVYVYHTVFSMIRGDKVSIHPLSDEIEIIGVNLKPFALRAFTQAYAYTFEWHVGPRRIFKEDLAALYQELLEKDDLQEKLIMLEQFLLNSIIGMPEPLLVHALDIIHTARVMPSVQELAVLLKVNDRTVRNHFQQEIGICPSEYLQLVRVHAALNDLRNSSKEQADIFFDNNYFDQAHFIHAFKRVADMSPRKFQKKIAAFQYLQF